MLGVLIDSSVLLDLVFVFQARHRRNRQVHSSAAAAIEAMVLHDELFYDATSLAGLHDTARASRYLEFYCDRPESGAAFFREVAGLCSPLVLTTEKVGQIYEVCTDILDAYLSPIEDVADLRAYELYDFLPYHLGEDPTALECGIGATACSDLDDVCSELPDPISVALQRFADLLRDRKHPVRAAWALPLLRFVFYQIVQQLYDLSLVPHATKSTLAIGRDHETQRSRRLPEYCTHELTDRIVDRMMRRFGAVDVVFPIPAFGAAAMRRASTPSRIVREIHHFREVPAAVAFRAQLNRTFQPRAEGERECAWAEHVSRLEALAKSWADELRISFPMRHVRAMVPFFAVGPGGDGETLANGHQIHGRSSLMFIHQLSKFE